jgi:hypothetical protein
MAEPPAWMESLVDTVIDCMEPHHGLGPLGFSWGNESDFWEICVYPTPAELIGGAEDGAVVNPGFSLDVQELCRAFEDLRAVSWQAHPLGPHDHDAPNVSFEGDYDGHDVWMRVLSAAPPDEEPGFKVDTTPWRQA